MKQKENIFEELNKMRSLIHSKPGVVISEQANPATDAGTVMRELDKTNSDESKIVNIVKNYKDKASFKNFLDQYKTISSTDFALDVARAIQPYNDPTEWKDLVNHLKTLGITATFIPREPVKGGSYIQLAGLNIPPTNTDEAWKTTYSCVTTQSGAKALKMSNGSTAYSIGQIVYYSNGRKKLADGTMANYTCAEFQSGALSNSRAGSESRQSGPSVNTRFADSAKSLGIENGKMDLQTLQTMLKSLEGGETTTAAAPTQGTQPDIAQLTTALNQLNA